MSETNNEDLHFCELSKYPFTSCPFWTSYCFLALFSMNKGLKPSHEVFLDVTEAQMS